MSMLATFEARDERIGSQRFQRSLSARLLDALSDMGISSRDVLTQCKSNHFTAQGWPAYAFWHAVVAVSGESGIGVQLAEHVGPTDFGLLGGLVSNSATLGDALLHGLRVSRLSLTSAQMRVQSDGEYTCVTLTSARPNALHHEEVDFILASGILAARSLTGKAVIPVEVSLAHDAPADQSHHRRVFRAPLRFAATQTACTLPTALLVSPLPNSDALLLSSLADKVEQRIAGSSGEFSQQVQAAILAELRSGDPSIKRVASRLGTQPHTLTRRLRASGLSYRELLVRTRFELASQYLQRAGTRMTTIADALGYSNKSAFIRAFTRRAGCSPIEYRRRTRSHLSEQ
jgi:AraC-like DNA-binding protein